MNCSTCFSDTLGVCNDYVTINAVFDILPYTEYKWQITDKFGNVYEGDLVIGEGPGVLIAVADLPDGFLTQYSGSFELKILEGDTCRPINFLMAKRYDTICFEIVGGTQVKDYLGCPILNGDP